MRAWAYSASRTANSEAICLAGHWLLGNRLAKLQEAHFNVDMETLHRASKTTVPLGGVTSVHVHVYTQMTSFMTMTKNECNE